MTELTANTFDLIRLEASTASSLIARLVMNASEMSYRAAEHDASRVADELASFEQTVDRLRELADQIAMNLNDVKEAA